MISILKRPILFKVGLPLLVALFLWYTPCPSGLEMKGWHLFALFFATITALITRPFPIGAVALFSILACSLTGTLNLKKEILPCFGSNLIWLVLFVIFIARAFLKTNLGRRLAYIFIKFFGSTSFGLGYGILLLELLTAPFIPSSTARSGAVIFPIVKSISQALGSCPQKNTSKKIGAYLTQVAYHGNIVTSAMFLTAMVANPMIQMMVAKMNVHITWILWAQAAIAPGLISLLILPIFLHVIYPPEVKNFPGAQLWAEKKLRELGKISIKERILIGVCLLMLFLWVTGDQFKIDTTLVALLGLSLLLLTNILTWEDILQEKESWNTLLWLSILLMLSSMLQECGFAHWISQNIASPLQTISTPYAFVFLCLLYFYSHYLFAGNVAHVGALYIPFLSVAISIGAPPIIAALVLAFFSSLFSSMTHYATAPAAILFSARYLSLKEWWICGFLISLVNVLIWLSLGSLWWKLLNLW